MNYLTLLFLIAIHTITRAGESQPLQLNPLTEAEKRVILEKGTERPYSGEYDRHFAEGTYVCRQCGAPLYRSGDKFDSGCGWPAFDDEIPGAVKRIPDRDGFRTEIVCARCGAHLGHVFTGEQLTKKNVRHCVNSIAMDFIPAATRKAYFAGGCFWGVEYHFENKEGVIGAVSGYMGGSTENPSYSDVSRKQTGHLEVVEVTYDPARVSYEELAKLFFEIHDPTQADGQGPDIGPQYRSVIFYRNDREKATAQKLIRILEAKGLKIATTLRPAATFYKAEKYHQDYYERKGSAPYCHSYRKRF
jgi:peptide methionine sulfoxide reductase msrA/msrB